MCFIFFVYENFWFLHSYMNHTETSKRNITFGRMLFEYDLSNYVENLTQYQSSNTENPLWKHYYVPAKLFYLPIWAIV